MLAGTALAVTAPALAADVTWLVTSGEYTSGVNWGGGVVPGSGDTAIFSGTDGLNVSSNTTAGSWRFVPGSTYAIFNQPTGSVTLDGSGIELQTGAALAFYNTGGSSTTFRNSASAGTATFMNVGGSVITFEDNSSALSGTYIGNSGASSLKFEDTSSAGSSVLTATDGSSIVFNGQSDAADAELHLSDHSTIDFSGFTGPNSNHKAAVASIQGDATSALILGANELSVGGNNTTSSFSGTVTGVGGSLVKNGSGTLTLDGTNTYSGGTTVAAGTLHVGNALALGAGDVTIKDGATLWASSSFGNEVILEGIASLRGGSSALILDISGTGTLQAVGTLFLAGTPAHTGGTRIDYGATLVLGDATNRATLAGSIEFDSLGARLDIVNADISGLDLRDLKAGSVVNFRASATAAASQVKTGGGFYFWDDTDAGTATIEGTAAGFAFSNQSSAANATITLGNGASAGGNFFFVDSSTAANAKLTIKEGTFVSFRDTATAADSEINLFRGDVSFNNSSDGARAKLTGDSNSQFDFSSAAGVNSDGKPRIGSVAGAAKLILGNRQLSIGTNDLSTELSGVISGNGGSIVKVGSGTLTLSGNSTYTGATTVSSGKLVVNGRIATSSGVTVTGGSLGGTGTVSSVTIGSGGAFAPGNSIGTMNVTGDVTFDAGSFFDVEVNAAGASDKIVASDDVIINGGTVRVSPVTGRYKRSTIYTIIEGDSVTGAFDAATSSLAFLDPVLNHGAKTVGLMMVRNTVDFEEAASTGNQKAVGAAAEALGPGNDLYEAVAMLTEEEARAAFDALSGEGHATIRGILVETSGLVLDALLGRLETLRSSPDSTETASGYFFDEFLTSERIASSRIWGQFYGGLGNRAGDAGTAAAEFGAGGLVLGADTDIDGWTVGVSLQAGTSSFVIPNRATTGSSVEAGLGVYASTSVDGTGYAFGATFTRYGISTTRSVQFPGFSETLTAAYGATGAQMFGEISREFDLGAIELTPFAQLAASGLATDAFTEQGGTAALASAASSTGAASATLGVRAEQQFVFGDAALGTLHASVAWRHTVGAAPVANNAFPGGNSFAATGTPLSSDALLLGAGINANLADGLDLSVDYSGQLGTNGQTHKVSARLGGAF